MEHSRTDVGDSVPPLVFEDVGGTPWHLDAQRGSVVVLIFHRHIH